MVNTCIQLQYLHMYISKENQNVKQMRYVALLYS